MRYGMSFCDRWASLPQAETATAPPPVTPRTVRNRRRFICSLMASPSPRSVVTYEAVARDLLLHVTADAPPHGERRRLVHLRHQADVAVARVATLAPERLDVPQVRKVDESRKRVDPDPLRRLAVAPRVAD